MKFFRNRKQTLQQCFFTFVIFVAMAFIDRQYKTGIQFQKPQTKFAGHACHVYTYLQCAYILNIYDNSLAFFFLKLLFRPCDHATIHHAVLRKYAYENALNRNAFVNILDKFNFLQRKEDRERERDEEVERNADFEKYVWFFVDSGWTPWINKMLRIYQNLFQSVINEIIRQIYWYLLSYLCLQIWLLLEPKYVYCILNIVYEPPSYNSHGHKCYDINIFILFVQALSTFDSFFCSFTNNFFLIKFQVDILLSMRIHLFYDDRITSTCPLLFFSIKLFLNTAHFSFIITCYNVTSAFFLCIFLFFWFHELK